MVTIRILKNTVIQQLAVMFDFLLQCRLTVLVQDIVVRQFDSDALMKAYIVGVSF